jgi:hypothetical protein
VLECLISFTKRELKIRTSAGTFFLLIGINTPFSSSSVISFCLNEVNDESTLMIKTKLVADAKNFLSRPRSRLIGAVGTIESIVMGLVCSGIDSINDSIDSIDEIDNSSLA